MPTFRSTRQVKHSAADMFALVADVERYPEFVPLCESLRVVRRAQSGEGIETIVAAMSVGYKAIRESFTSRVELDHPRLRIDVEYVDGPFKYLENRWTFRDTPDGSEVGFYINYEFKSFALGLLMGAVFDKAFRKFAEAFEERADFVYFSRRAIAAGRVGDLESVLRVEGAFQQAQARPLPPARGSPAAPDRRSVSPARAFPCLLAPSRNGRGPRAWRRCRHLGPRRR